MMQPDHSMWKIVFGFMLVVALLVFVGALALSDADIFNREAAQAAALQANSQTAYETQRGQIDLSVYPQLVQERTQAEISSIRAQAAGEAAAAAETIRVAQAENDRKLAARRRFDQVKLVLATLAAGGVLVVALYALTMVAQRGIDRLLPLPRPVTAERHAPAERDAAVAPAVAPVVAVPNPWRNPAFQMTMRRLARQREQEQIAHKLAKARTAPPPRANGHGPHHLPLRERQPD